MKRSVLIFLTRYRRWVALACWLLAILLFLAQAAWNIMAERDAAQNRLQNEAGRVASRFTHLLGLHGELTAVSTDALVTGLMEDQRLYAVTVQVGDSLFPASAAMRTGRPCPGTARSRRTPCRA